MSCTIKNNLLIKACSKNQKSLKSKKCYKNRCYSVNKVLKAGNKYGNINVINSERLVIKWNKEPIKSNSQLNKLKIEIKCQNLASKYKLAPKIKQFYIHDNYVYIVMDNLFYYGYHSLLNVLKENIIIKKKVFNNLFKKLNKLHEIGVYHGDLHFNNIFYNKKTNDVIMLDYGRSKLNAKDSQILKDLRKFQKIFEYAIKQRP